MEFTFVTKMGTSKDKIKQILGKNDTLHTNPYQGYTPVTIWNNNAWHTSSKA